MAASTVSSIIFILLLIITSLFIDGNVFATSMEHRKLGGSNGPNKIATPGSTTTRSGQKNSENKPSETHPDQVHTKRYKSYGALQAQQVPVCGNNNRNCTKPIDRKQHGGCARITNCRGSRIVGGMMEPR